ncbi:MAG: metallophosphoesterase family protein [Planctomycetota bacterium]|jgi:DNA repair exonuclease SbcCD nuclease subunit
MLCLHLADMHLDGEAVASRLGLPPDKREIRKQELCQVFASAMELAKERGVDAVLIPGDLWDDESVSPETVAFVGEQFHNLGDIPVFIAPGNHDFYALGCGYDPLFWRWERLSPWPSNVHIFTAKNFEAIIHPKLPDVVVVGRAFQQNVEIKERLLRKHLERSEATINLLLFHGSRLGYESNKGFITAPFEDGELLLQDFSYTALGHYHQHQVIKDSDGYIRAAYPGCTAGRTLGEEGDKGILLLEVSKNGVNPEKMEFVGIDHRRICKIKVDLTSIESHDAMERRIRTSVNQSGAGNDDIVYVQLVGQYPPAIPPALPNDFLIDVHWHVHMVNMFEPDYDFEGYLSGEAKTVEARYARELLTRLEVTQDPKERAILREALHLGLDALIRGQVVLREFTSPLREEGEP